MNWFKIVMKIMKILNTILLATGITSFSFGIIKLFQKEFVLGFCSILLGIVIILVTNFLIEIHKEFGEIEC